jgi:hypothetical protein
MSVGEQDLQDSEPESLDLTGAPVEPDKASPEQETISEKREDTRKLMAIGLLLGLALVAFAWAAVGVWGDQDAVTNAGDALDKIFTGILGLTGTAVGFYFGAGGTANGNNR